MCRGRGNKGGRMPTNGHLWPALQPVAAARRDAAMSTGGRRTLARQCLHPPVRLVLQVDIVGRVGHSPLLQQQQHPHGEGACGANEWRSGPAAPHATPLLLQPPAAPLRTEEPPKGPDAAAQGTQRAAGSGGVAGCSQAASWPSWPSPPPALGCPATWASNSAPVAIAARELVSFANSNSREGVAVVVNKGRVGRR